MRVVCSLVFIQEEKKEGGGIGLGVVPYVRDYGYRPDVQV